MIGKLKLVSESTVDPITLQEARLHLRLDTEGSPASHPDDSIVEVLIKVARQSAEQYLGRSLVQQTYELALDRFPNPEQDASQAISLQTWPVNSVTSIVYQDPDGNAQTLAVDQYIVDQFAKPAQITAVTLWPSTKPVTNSVIVTFVAGHQDSSPNGDAIPKPIIQAMLLMIGHLYEHRESVTSAQTYEMPLGSTALMTPYRLSMGL
jgi:uncharacterized phiE125 gp8 family phage protein